MQKVVHVLEDDLDGSEAQESIVFSLDGAEYEIDLSAKNAEKLRADLAGYIRAGRRTGGRRKRGSGGVDPRQSSQAVAIREWASRNGVDVNARGRIPESIRDQYEKAQNN